MVRGIGVPIVSSQHGRGHGRAGSRSIEVCPKRRPAKPGFLRRPVRSPSGRAPTGSDPSRGAPRRACSCRTCDVAMSTREKMHSGPEVPRRSEKLLFGAHGTGGDSARKQSNGTSDEELFKGLSQLGAGYVHLLRGNAHGVAPTLLRRAASRVGRLSRILHAWTMAVLTAPASRRMPVASRPARAFRAWTGLPGRCPCSRVRMQPGRSGLRGRRPPHGHAVHQIEWKAAPARSPVAGSRGVQPRRPRAEPGRC